MGFAIGGSAFWGLYGPNTTIEQADTAYEQKATHPGAKSKKEETDEALARYTLWLMVFTGVLALATIGLGAATVGLYLTGEKQVRVARRASQRQFIQTKESIQVANRSAAAAERAFIELERPWLFLESVTITPRDPSTMTVIQNNWNIKLHWKNLGRSPAIVTDCIFKVSEFSTIGPDPDYTDAGGLFMQRTISVGQSASTNEVGPAPTAQNRQGAELLFFGRLTYCELNGRPHHTGFALRVAPDLPAYASFENKNYDYYD